MLCSGSAGEQAGQWCVLWPVTPCVRSAARVARPQMSEAACEVWALGADPGQCEDVSSVVSIITSDLMMRAW